MDRNDWCVELSRKTHIKSELLRLDVLEWSHLLWLWGHTFRLYIVHFLKAFGLPPRAVHSTWAHVKHGHLRVETWQVNISVARSDCTLMAHPAQDWRPPAWDVQPYLKYHDLGFGEGWIISTIELKALEMCLASPSPPALCKPGMLQHDLSKHQIVDSDLAAQFLFIFRPFHAHCSPNI